MVCDGRERIGIERWVYLGRKDRKPREMKKRVIGKTKEVIGKVSNHSEQKRWDSEKKAS